MTRKRAFSKDRLQKARNQTGKTQEELAEELGISQRQYSRYETGTTEPSGHIIRQLAIRLDVTTDYLFGLSESPNDHMSFESLSADEQRLILAYRNRNAGAVLSIVGDRLEPKK